MTQPVDLAGRRIVVTRALQQAQPLLAAIARCGGEGIGFPLLRIEDPVGGLDALHAAVDALTEHDWLVVTSPNAAERVIAACSDGEFRLAVVGSGTAAVFRTVGREPDLIPENPSAEGLVAEFPDPADGVVLLALGDLARPTLADGLSAAGWSVDIVEAYRNVPVEAAPEQVETVRSADTVVFASPSAVQRYVDRVGMAPSTAICIGAVTGAAAHEAGFEVTISDTPSVDGIVEALGSSAC